MSNEAEPAVVEEPAPATEATEAPAVDKYAEEAKTYGWLPAEDFSGDGNHMTAEAFMTRGPGTSRKSQAENAELKKELGSVRGDMEARFTRMEQANKVRMEAEIEDRAQQIASAKLTAVEDGDVEKYKELTQEELTKKAKPVVDGVSEAEHGAMESWVAVNPWFTEDRAASQSAVADYETFKSRGLSPTDALEKVTDRAKVRSPWLFEAEAKPKPAAVAAVDAGGVPRQTSAKKGWGDIPADDRRMVARQISDGDWDVLAKKNKVTPQAAYAAEYWSQDNG